MKSQKLVDFPLKDFDPEQYLAPRSLTEEYRRETSCSFSEPGTPGTPSQAGDYMPPMMMNGSMASMCNYLEVRCAVRNRDYKQPSHNAILTGPSMNTQSEYYVLSLSE